MFSKSQIKLINSLAVKKHRVKYQLFTVEGRKAVSELLDSGLELHSLYTTEDVFEAEKEKIFVIEENDLKKISRLTTPQAVLAVFRIPVYPEPDLSGLSVALDEVQDPGNLGTIIRLCDWFGVKQLICSEGTVDCFNPKVVQATMGSIARVQISYVNLPLFLRTKTSALPVYGAMLEGERVYNSELNSNAILVLGNEANGISSEVASQITKKIHIPQFGTSDETESLNVATATAILLSEFRRR